MRILIRNENGRLRRALRLLVARHVRRTLRGLRELRPRVSVSLSDTGEAVGTLDKRCTVQLEAADAGKVVVSALAKNWSTALRLALRGASERLRSAWLERLRRTPVRALPAIASTSIR